VHTFLFIANQDDYPPAFSLPLQSAILALMSDAGDGLAFAYRAGAGFRPELVAPNSDGYDK
jgi:hypothetical protein